MASRRPDFDQLSFGVVFGIVAAVGTVFLVAPTIVLLITSFTSSESLKFPPDGFSLRWYAALGEADQIRNAAWNSLIVAMWTTALSVVLGVAAALAIGRSNSRWAKALDALFMSPLLLPALAFGFGALIYVNLIGMQNFPLTALIAGHIVVCAPYVVRNTIAALSQLNPALLDASASLGAGAFYTFRRVTLPLIGRGVAAGAFIAFMSSFDNVPVSLFLADARTQMLPIHMWEIIETNLDVRTAAVSGVIVMITIVLMVTAEKLVGFSRQLR
jgi:putative spermidine/putrescine transport system permease protein